MRLTHWIPAIGLAVLATSANAQTQTKYVRYEAGNRVSWGILDGESIRELQGSVFEKATPTGKTVKLARASRPDLVTEAEVKETVRYKRITSPLFTFAILMLIAAPVSGGPLLRIPREGPGGWLTLHLVTVIATLVLQFYTAFMAVRIIGENVRLLDTIDARLIASPEPAPPPA